MTMRKIPGFTLIELMTVITILGILFVITVPEYQHLREKNNFRSQSQLLWDQLATARSSALTNKKCPDDTVATAWQVVLAGVNNGATRSHTFNCVNGSDFDADLVNVVATNELIDTDVSILEIDGAVIPDLSTTTVTGMRINFLAGSAQTRIEILEPTETPDVSRIEQFRLVLDHTYFDSALQQTLCLERVGGFPTINKYGNVCEADA